jgi:hypothetical protein
MEDTSGLEFITESYSLKVNLCIDIQVYNKRYSTGIMYMIKVIGKILSEYKVMYCYLEPLINMNDAFMDHILLNIQRKLK